MLELGLFWALRLKSKQNWKRDKKTMYEINLLGKNFSLSQSRWSWLAPPRCGCKKCKTCRTSLYCRYQLLRAARLNEYLQDPHLQTGQDMRMSSKLYQMFRSKCTPNILDNYPVMSFQSLTVLSRYMGTQPLGKGDDEIAWGELKVWEPMGVVPEHGDNRQHQVLPMNGRPAALGWQVRWQGGNTLLYFLVWSRAQEFWPAVTVSLSLNLPWVPWDLRPAEPARISRVPDIKTPGISEDCWVVSRP